MILLEIKYDTKDLLLLQGVNFAPCGGKRVCMILKGEICAIKLHTDCMYSEMLPYKEDILACFSLLSEGLEGLKSTSVFL